MFSSTIFTPSNVLATLFTNELKSALYIKQEKARNNYVAITEIKQQIIWFGKC